MKCSCKAVQESCSIAYVNVLESGGAGDGGGVGMIEK